jgi:hypothetical protein
MLVTVTTTVNKVQLNTFLTNGMLLHFTTSGTTSDVKNHFLDLCSRIFYA